MSVQEHMAHAERPIEWVEPEQLPFSCPPKNSDLWNMHPRVFLHFDAQDEVTCPYCGARYRLKND